VAASSTVAGDSSSGSRGVFTRSAIAPALSELTSRVLEVVSSCAPMTLNVSATSPPGV
jgi:hypothetical protein